MAMNRPNEESSLSNLNDDVFLLVCDAVGENKPDRAGIVTTDLGSLKALSQCSQRFRRVLAPRVFKRINVCPRTWTEAQAMVESISHSEDARRFAEKFKVSFTTKELEESTVPSGFVRDFYQTLGHLTRLQNLQLFELGQLLSAFAAGFESTDISLPSVRSLSVQPRLSCLIPRCPNLQHVSLGAPGWCAPRPEDDAAAIAACGKMSQLRCFELRTRWTPELLRAVHAAMPGLTGLGIGGHRFTLDGEYVSLLGAFTQLRRLILPAVWSLDVGFDPPRCGNAYMGPHGAAVRARVDREQAAAHEKVARICFAACDALKALRTQNMAQATVSRDEAGDVAAVHVVTELEIPKDWLASSMDPPPSTKE